MKDRYVVPIPLWLYCILAVVAAVVWVGIVAFVGAVFLLVLLITVLVVVGAWIIAYFRRKNQERRDRRGH